MNENEKINKIKEAKIQHHQKIYIKHKTRNWMKKKSADYYIRVFTFKDRIPLWSRKSDKDLS